MMPLHEKIVVAYCHMEDLIESITEPLLNANVLKGKEGRLINGLRYVNLETRYTNQILQHSCSSLNTCGHAPELEMNPARRMG